MVFGLCLKVHQIDPRSNFLGSYMIPGLDLYTMCISDGLKMEVVIKMSVQY